MKNCIRSRYSCKISICSHMDGWTWQESVYSSSCSSKDLWMYQPPPLLIHKHTGCLYNADADPPSFSSAIYKPSSMQGEERGQFMPCPSRPTHGPWGLPGPDFRELFLESLHGRASEERGRRSDRWGRGKITDTEHNGTADDGGNVNTFVRRFMFNTRAGKYSPTYKKLPRVSWARQIPNSLD